MNPRERAGPSAYDLGSEPPAATAQALTAALLASLVLLTSTTLAAPGYAPVPAGPPAGVAR